MKRATKSILLHLLSLTLFSISSINLTFAASPTAFIRRNPRQLALAALTLSANRTRDASAYINQLSSSDQSGLPGALQDCMRAMADGSDRLQRSVVEMERLGRAGSGEFRLHMSNAQTWVSGALTDQNECLDSLVMDGRAGGSGREMVRKKVVEVREATSNALALVNGIGSEN